MLFPTVTFAVFFVTVYAVHTALHARDRAWKVAMVVASYVFYGWWDWRFCGLLASSTLVNWGYARLLAATAARRARRALVATAVAADLAVLGVFKYYGFFAEALSHLLGADHTLPGLDVVLPVGISFFTFQAVSYVVDTYRGEVDDRSLLDFTLYLSFFPHLVAGPIVRASEFLPQLTGRRHRGDVDVVGAAWWIGRGLFKKVVVATFLAQSVVDPVFAAPSAATRLQLLAALYGYAMQIYADFSGYTDIAIGLAALLGIRFPVNFDRPYGAVSIQDFWRRWHMTLSRWLRDYLYLPLGGNRRGRLITYRNLLLTMVLGGLWHGAAWTFVVWGTVHGLALAVERLLGRSPAVASLWTRSRAAAGRRTGAGAPTWLGPAARWLVTFHLVCLAWVPFRAQSLGETRDFLAGLVRGPEGATAAGSVSVVAVGLIATALAVQLVPAGQLNHVYHRWFHRPLTRLDPALQSALMGVWLSLVVALGPQGVAPFIYFRF
ncbi:MAG: MBOAT family protein [Acidimicrobiia bacterium]|nr:MBOAT family protein [Acidimicrobiia bacterium]